MKNFNKLTPAELERLALLAEECSEVIQIVGKILRHGYSSHHPDDCQKRTNRDLLTKELGDLHYSIKLMIHNDDIVKENIEAFSNIKASVVQQYLHCQHKGRWK